MSERERERKTLGWTVKITVCGILPTQKENERLVFSFVAIGVELQQCSYTIACAVPDNPQIHTVNTFTAWFSSEVKWRGVLCAAYAIHSRFLTKLLDPSRWCKCQMGTRFKKVRRAL
jgi:hypothetical protein